MHVLLLFIAGISLFLGMANPVCQVPLLALLFPAALYLNGLTARTGFTAFRNAMLTGIAGYTACIYWVAVPLEEQAGLPLWLAAPAPLLLASYLALYAGLFSLAIHSVQRRISPAGLPVFAGLLWGGLEFLRGTLFTGFPWAILSASLVPWPWLLQPVAILGAYGFASVLVFIVCQLTQAVYSHRLRTVWPAVATIFICTLTSSLLWQAPIPTTGPVRAAMVQGNIDQGQKWVPAYQNGTVQRYVTMTQGALDKAAVDLIVWPETSMPFYLQEKKEYLSLVRDMVVRSGAPLLVGTPAYNKGTEGRQWDTLNRAYLLTPDGLMQRWYDKEHLVPFGEYLPMGQYLPFLQVFFEGTGEFQTSSATRPISFRNLALGVLICYETIFPELAQQRVADGANLLVNISNDAWFGRTAAPEQHLQLAALRALEQGRYLIRATNTGISAVVDPKGRLLKRSALFRAEVLVGMAATVDTTTPYHAAHPFIPVILLGGAALIPAVALRRKPTL